MALSCAGLVGRVWSTRWTGHFLFQKVVFYPPPPRTWARNDWALASLAAGSAPARAGAAAPLAAPPRRASPCLARTRRRACPARLPPARARLVGRMLGPRGLHLERQPAPAAPRGARGGRTPPDLGGAACTAPRPRCPVGPVGPASAASCTGSCMPLGLQHTAHLAPFSGSWACERAAQERETAPCDAMPPAACLQCPSCAPHCPSAAAAAQPLSPSAPPSHSAVAAGGPRRRHGRAHARRR